MRRDATCRVGGRARVVGGVLGTCGVHHEHAGEVVESLDADVLVLRQRRSVALPGDGDGSVAARDQAHDVDALALADLRERQGRDRRRDLGNTEEPHQPPSKGRKGREME